MFFEPRGGGNGGGVFVGVGGGEEEVPVVDAVAANPAGEKVERTVAVVGDEVLISFKDERGLNPSEGKECGISGRGSSLSKDSASIQAVIGSGGVLMDDGSATSTSTGAISAG